MRHRSPARWLAPLALIAVGVGVFTIVSAALTTGDQVSAPQRTAQERTTDDAPAASESRSETSDDAPASRPRTYVVKSGDTLSAIAVKTGVALEELQRLNPDIDTQALQTGQRIKLEA
jgi:LysM repeat protein